MKALEFVSLSDAEAIAFISPIIIENHNETGILASVLLAQFIYESDYGKSELRRKATMCLE